jgi:FAD binding domain
VTSTRVALEKNWVEDDNDEQATSTLGEHLLNGVRNLWKEVNSHGNRRLMQWLKSEGIDLVDLGGYQTNVLAPAWRKGFGLTWRGYAGDVALARLEENLRQRQGRILRGMRARGLKLASGGIEVETVEAEGATKFNAPSVVIADGNFQANLDMIRAHICSAPEKLLARNGGTATGDGLCMAQAVGTASSGLGMFYGHLHSRDAMNTVRLWPRPYVDEIAAASVVIHADGHRFADEGLDGAGAKARRLSVLALRLSSQAPVIDEPDSNLPVQRSRPPIPH